MYVRLHLARSNLMARACRVRAWVVLLVWSALVLGTGNVVIWAPLWWHYRVSPATVTTDVIATHRRAPDDAALSTIAEMSMTTDHPLRGDAAVAAAKELLAGKLVLPNLPVVTIDPAFSPRDLVQGVPVHHVFTASLIVPDLLLRAHEHRPDPAYVAAAWRYARGFIEYEQGVWFPLQYERNSHAVANRASVLARLWRHLRGARDADPDAAALVHLHAQRLAALLSKPSHFVAATNHGVMQNVALLQLAAAFPALPRAADHRRLALRRLAMQLPGYIAPDGGVLEHAAGYHFHGVVVSGYVTRLLRLLGQPPPPDLAAAHDRALAVLAELQRPDASLPQYGNTYRYAWSLPPVLGMEPVSWRRTLGARGDFARILPVAGQALWWSRRAANGEATHTMVPWGYFAGNGHRRAQELSLLIWSAGTDWSTNTGYWPGDDPAGARAAEGWDGGNGPHVVGEPAEGPRRGAQLRAHADEGDLRFLDLERTAALPSPHSMRIRRQVLQWRGGTFAVLDTYADSARRDLRVLWTAAPEATQRELAPRQYRYEREGSPLAMTLSVEGAPSLQTRALRGSRDPFGGWVAFDRKAAPAAAVDARLPGGSGWMLCTIDLHAPGAYQQARMTRFASPEDWTLRLEQEGRTGSGLEVTRLEAKLLLRWLPGEAGSESRTVPLRAGESPEAQLRVIEQSHAELLAAYPRYRTLETVREKQSRALMALWALGVVFVGALTFVCRRRAG